MPHMNDSEKPKYPPRRSSVPFLDGRPLHKAPVHVYFGQDRPVNTAEQNDEKKGRRRQVRLDFFERVLDSKG